MSRRRFSSRRWDLGNLASHWTSNVVPCPTLSNVTHKNGTAQHQDLAWASSRWEVELPKVIMKIACSVSLSLQYFLDPSSKPNTHGEAATDAIFRGTDRSAKRKHCAENIGLDRTT
jgi:hypothetical protein